MEPRYWIHGPGKRAGHYHQGAKASRWIQASDGEVYQLNFIDTPGHVDFSYEVSRSLAACEGALLVVDAAQGVEAQSVANCYTAIEQGLEVVPVLNKIDLPSAEPERVMEEIENVIGIPADEALKISAKTVSGVEAVLDQLIQKIRHRAAMKTPPLQALIIDSGSTTIWAWCRWYVSSTAVCAESKRLR